MMRALVHSWGKVLLAIGLGVAVIVALLYGSNPLERRPVDSQAAASPATEEAASNQLTSPSIDEPAPKKSETDVVADPP